MRKCVVLFLILVVTLVVAALTEPKTVEVTPELAQVLAKK